MERDLWRHLGRKVTTPAKVADRILHPAYSELNFPQLFKDLFEISNVYFPAADPVDPS